MIAIAVVAAVLILVALGVVYAVRRQVSWLKRQPEFYPPEVLAKDPDGVVEFIGRPDGTQLRAVSKGTGKATVVFAHGYGMSLREWNVIWSRLSGEGYRLIAFDHRGHGKSTVGRDGMGSAVVAADFAAVLEHFDVRDGILVGHSLGGFLSMVFMTQHLEVVKTRLRGAVMVATFAGVILRGGPVAWPPASTSSDLLPRAIWRETVCNALVRFLIGSGILPGLVQTPTGHALSRGLMGTRPYYSAIDEALCSMAAHDHRRSLLGWLAPVFEDHYPRLKAISVPCIALYGDADNAARPWHAERIAREIPNSRAVCVKGSGHMMNWEAPEAIIEAIRGLGANPGGRA